MSVTIRKATNDEMGSMARSQSWYMVERDGKIVGRIVKPKNSKHDIYPWNVYRLGEPIAAARFYDDADSVKIGKDFDYNTCKTGGKTAAFIFARRIFANG